MRGLALAAMLLVAGCYRTGGAENGGDTWAVAGDTCGGDASGGGGDEGQPLPSYQQAVLTDAPLAYWRFDEISGGVALDASGNGNDAAYSNCVLGAPGALLGDANDAVRLEGQAASFVIGPSYPFAGNAPFSLEVWFNLLSISTGEFQHLLNNETQVGNRQGYALVVAPDGRMFFERFVDSLEIDAQEFQLQTGRYYYAAVTYDGVAMVLYVDGVVVASANDVRPSVATTEPFYVGSGSGQKLIHGFLDEVAIYDHALTASRVGVHYRASGR